MSDQSIPLSDLTSGPSAKFEQIGDTVTGRIESMDKRPQTDINTGQVRYFSDGVTPRMQYVIVLRQADGSFVNVYARGGNYSNYKILKGSGESMLSAIGNAARDAGASAIDPGALLTVTFSGEAEAQVGKAKLYTAHYEPPVKGSVPTDLFAQS